MAVCYHLAWIVAQAGTSFWAGAIHRKLQAWGVTAIKMVPNLLLALLCWLLFFMLARLFRRFGYRIVHRFSKSKAVGGLFFDLIYVAILLAGLYVGLNVLSLDKIAVSLLAGAGIVGLTLAFAFQDLTANFISGVYIDFNKPFGIGDVIETNGLTGEVLDIGLRSTVLRSPEGTHLQIPNKNVFQTTLINHSRTGARRLQLDFEMLIGEQMHSVPGRLTDAVRAVPGVDGARPVQCFFTDINAHNLKMSLFFWISGDRQAEMAQTRHGVILAVLDAFRHSGIKRLG